MSDVIDIKNFKFGKKRMSAEEKNKILEPYGYQIENSAIYMKAYFDDKQMKQIDRTLGCSRYIYNKYIDDDEKMYKDTKKSLTANSFMKTITPLKNTEEFGWLGKVDKFALESSAQNAEAAFKNFFDKKAKYPKYKSKYASEQSYTTKFTENNIEFDFKNSKLKLPYLKWFSIKFDDKLMDKYATEGIDFKILKATITKTSRKEYYVSVNIERIIPIVQTISFNVDELDKIVTAFDLGLISFYTDSDGNTVDCPKYLRKAQDDLRKAQKRLSRMEKGSSNYQKQKVKVAKIHGYISNCRENFLHQLSNKVVKSSYIMVFEDLNVKGMIKNSNLAKSIADAGWSKFLTFVEYKAKKVGKIVIYVDRYFASSKICSNCGEKNVMLTLSHREWLCGSCGKTNPRDENAAINLKKEAIRMILNNEVKI